MPDRPLDDALLSFLEPQISRHKEWLSKFPAAERKWTKMYAAAPESAVVEACSRALLESRAGEVEPAEDEAGSGPDFRVAGNQGEFLVEVTALTRAKVEAATTILDHPAPYHSGRYLLMTGAIQEKARAKAKQLGGASVPGLLIVGTLHCQVQRLLGRMCMEMIFTGEPKITSTFNPATGSCSGSENVIDLQNSSIAELKPGAVVEPRRQSLSGLLLAMFATHEAPMGLLHHDPVRPFKKFPLRGIEYVEYDGVDCAGSPKFKWDHT